MSPAEPDTSVAMPLWRNIIVMSTVSPVSGRVVITIGICSDVVISTVPLPSSFRRTSAIDMVKVPSGVSPATRTSGTTSVSPDMAEAPDVTGWPRSA